MQYDGPSMQPSDCTLILDKKNIQMKALIQDISACRSSIEALNSLNEVGRAWLSEIREGIESIDAYAKMHGNKRLASEMACQKHQLTSAIQEFKEANIKSLFAIEKAQREELLNPTDHEDSSLRQRKKIDKSGLIKMSTDVTEQLLNISRQLADTNQRSQNTLDSLVASSTTVHGTNSELMNTAGTINQSSKLLKKYGRREFTDKIIMFFAFLFFIAVCLYIVQKRLF